MAKTSNTYWCCKADFGQHEESCPNKATEVSKGKYPIDRPCSACGEDPEMKLHDHSPPFRPGYGPTEVGKEAQQRARRFDVVSRNGMVVCANLSESEARNKVENEQRMGNIMEVAPHVPLGRIVLEYCDDEG